VPEQGEHDLGADVESRRVAGSGGDSLMKTVEENQAAIEAAVPGAKVEIVPNPSPSGQHSLRWRLSFAVDVATFLRDDADSCPRFPIQRDRR
jgi:hypothetical protein